MIPVLYDELENLFPSGSSYSDKESIVKGNIPSHKIGYLADTLSCTVTEERNGQYELVLTYPSTGVLFEDIIPGRCIMAKAHSIGDDQLFRIYRTSKVLRGTVTVCARHISYDLSGVDYDKQYAGLAPAPAPETWLNTFLLDTNFVGKSDITTTGQVLMNKHVLASVKSFLGGMEGSVLDTFHGEYLWDNFVVNLKTARGANRGLVVEYGKNLTDMNVDLDVDNVYTGIRPCARYYNASGEERVAVAPEISTGVTLGYEWTKILDVTEALGLESNEVPTQAQITAAANAWLAQNPIGPVPNITVSFVDTKTLIRSLPSANSDGVYPTPEIPYPGVDLCDTVKVRYVDLGVSIDQKVVRTEYNTLLERYDSITLGAKAANLASDVNTLEQAVASLKKEKPVFTSGSKSVDLSGGVVTIYDGTYTTKLTAGIGRRVHDNGSEQSISSGTTMQNLAEFELTKGTWAVSVSVRFASNATGRRAINMADTSGGSAINAFWGDGSAAVNGAYTYLRLASTVRVTDATHTYFVNGYQNSGSALNVTAAYDAVRIY